MKIVALIVGAVSALLGGLWLLQGLDLVRIAPILCVANCEPIVGGSLTWSLIGGVAMLVGVLAILYGLKRPTSR